VSRWDHLPGGGDPEDDDDLRDDPRRLAALIVQRRRAGNRGVTFDSVAPVVVDHGDETRRETDYSDELERNMTTTAIRDLLERVRDDGVLPSTEEIVEVLPSTSSRGEREGDKRRVRVAAKKIVALLSGDSAADDPDMEIAEIIAATDESVSGHITRALMDELTARKQDGSVDREQRRQANIAKMKQRQPLVEILRLAGPQRGIDPRDLYGLPLKAGLSAEQQHQWRAKVEKAGERVARLHRAGNLADAQHLADELAEDLGEALAPVPGHRDPHADVTDPRELADVIRNRQQLGG
jgi:hypothetical protein